MDPIPIRRPVAEPLRLWERVAVTVDIAFGLVLCALAAFLIVAALNPDTPEGGWFEQFGALVSGPSGLLFLVAALAVRRGWRWRLELHLLPLFAPVVMVALVERGLLGG
jgi:hypothetical protein